MATEKVCVKALDEHEKRLSTNPQVQGLGIVAEEGKPFDSADCAVAVYVEKKVPAEEIAEEHRLPETLRIEHEGDVHQVPVRVIEQGPVSLEEPGLGSVGGAVPGLEGGLAEPGLEEPGLEKLEPETAESAAADDSEE